MKKSILEQERVILTQKLEKVRENLEYLRLLDDNLPDLYRAQPELLSEMKFQNNNRMIRMRQALEKPYFARIDFKAGDSSDHGEEQCYLGKIGIVDEHQQMVTVDWRAPIATLYYDSNLGRAAYEAPEGNIEGELLLKRQYDIEAGELRTYSDVETVTNDELLMPYLAADGDNRLKNIVATIQGEQNRIIRETISKNLIVQGVAGSGKTTVALHRIAYLVYRHRDEIKPRQYMVIGPNRFFISYIASVLPDLDVDSVPDHTFETLCRDYINENFAVESLAHGLTEILRNEDDGRIDRLKASMTYKDGLDRFFDELLDTAVPQKELVFRGFTVLSREQIEDTYATVDCKLNTTLQSRVNQCILYLSSQIENDMPLYRERLDKHLLEEARHDKAGVNLEKRRRDREAILKELECGCRKILKKHFSVTETSILKLYTSFLSNCHRYLPARDVNLNALKEYTFRGLRQKVVRFADLPALIYLKLRMKGPGEYGAFRHAVVDEAQDFGAFHFYTLRGLLSGSTFTIVGDLAQAIFNYRGINRWEDVRELAFGGNADIMRMSKSYRTTVEIMQSANNVVKRMGLPPAEPVIRHGAPVRFISCEPKKRVEIIQELIRQYRETGYQTIALICKTEDTVQEINGGLQQAGVAVEQITPESASFKAGVCTIPGYLSKGLEFDAVILCDASQTVYRSECSTDMHILYVSMTRALHRLDALYSGLLAEPLMDSSFENI